MLNVYSFVRKLETYFNIFCDSYFNSHSFRWKVFFRTRFLSDQLKNSCFYKQFFFAKRFRLDFWTGFCLDWLTEKFEFIIFFFVGQRQIYWFFILRRNQITSNGLCWRFLWSKSMTTSCWLAKWFTLYESRHNLVAKKSLTQRFIPIEI